MADVEHNTLAGTANMHGIYRLTVANAAALAALSPPADDVGKVVWQLDTDELWFLKSETGPVWVRLVPAGTTSIPGTMSGADKTKLDGIEALADVTDDANVRTALAAATADVAFNSRKITGLAAATGAGHAWRWDEVQTARSLYWCWGASAANATTADRWLNTASTQAVLPGSPRGSNLPAPSACTLREAYAIHDTAVADQIVYTVQVNGVDTTIVVTVSGGATTANNTTNSAAVSASDLVAIKSVQSGTTAGSNMAPRFALARSPG